MPEYGRPKRTHALEMAMAGPVPLISLEENAKGPVLRYDIPEPTAYSGFNLIELGLDLAGPIFKQTLMDDANSRVVATMRVRKPKPRQKRLNSCDLQTRKYHKTHKNFVRDAYNALKAVASVSLRGHDPCPACREDFRRGDFSRRGVGDRF